MADTPVGMDSGWAHDHALAPAEDISHRLGSVAGWAVSACAVHCVLTPFATILPLVGAGVFASSWGEWTPVGIAAVIGGGGFGISYARVHRKVSPVLVFLAGVCVLVATHTLLEGRPILHATGAVAGAILILIAASINHRLVHACERCHPHPHRSRAIAAD